MLEEGFNLGKLKSDYNNQVSSVPSPPPSRISLIKSYRLRRMADRRAKKVQKARLAAKKRKGPPKKPILVGYCLDCGDEVSKINPTTKKPYLRCFSCFRKNVPLVPGVKRKTFDDICEELGFPIL